jgi:hypothetical protein
MSIGFFNFGSFSGQRYRWDGEWGQRGEEGAGRNQHGCTLPASALRFELPEGSRTRIGDNESVDERTVSSWSTLASRPNGYFT